MALRGALTHWKTRVLARRLGIPPCYALGLLEALWHTTAELAPAGNIGRLPNEAIAMEMFYTDDADQLIAALIESKHLDVCDQHRLVVHDWSQHCDYNTRRKLERRGESLIADTQAQLIMTRHASPKTADSRDRPVVTRHESIPEPEPEPEPVITPPTPSRTRGREAKPDVRPNAKHVASERAIGMYRPGPPEPQRTPEDEAALEREVDALFAKPERAHSRRAPGDLARLGMPPTLAALRTQLARPEPSAGLTAARAMLQHLYALFQAQFNKPGNEAEGWEDALAAWNRCFEHVTVGEVELDGETTVVYLEADRPRDLADGLAKYQHKVRTAMRQAFGREVQIVPRDVAVAA